MPQTQGPVVIQNPRQQNYFGAALGQGLGQAAGAVLSGVAGAAGKFLGNLIHEDPQEALIKANTDVTRSANLQNALAAYQNWLAAGGEDRVNSPESRSQFARSYHLDDEEAAAFESLAASTDTKSGILQKANSNAATSSELSDYEQKQEGLAPFTIGGGLSASVPPPEMTAQGGTSAQNGKASTGVAPAAAASLVQPTVPTASNTSPEKLAEIQAKAESPLTPPAPSAQAEAQQKELAAGTTVAPAKELPPIERKADALVEPPAPKPAPISPQEAQKRRALANLAFTRLQGTMAQLGQIRLAHEKGTVDPKMTNAAVAMTQAMESDINSMVEQGLALQGLPPNRDVNFAKASYQLAAYKASHDPVMMERLKAAGWDTDQIMSEGQKWVDTASKMSPAALTMITPMADLFKFEPGNQSTINASIAKNHLEFNKQVHADEVKQANEMMQLRRNEDARQDKILATKLGLDMENVRGLRLSNDLKEQLMGPMAEEGRLKVSQLRQQIQQQAKEFGVTLEGKELNNLASYAVLVDHDYDVFLKMQSRQDTADAAAEAKAYDRITKIEKIRADYINQTKKGNLGALIESVSKIPPAEVERRAKKNPTAFQEALSLVAEGTPTEADKVQAAIAVESHEYAEYLRQLHDYDKAIENQNALITRIVAKQDKGVAAAFTEWQKAIRDPANAGQVAAQKRNLDFQLQSYAQGVYDKQRTRIIDAVKDMDTITAKQALLNSPDKLDVILGNFAVTDGRVKVTSGGLSDEEKAALFIMARTPGGVMSPDQFAKMQLGPQTLGQRFGKNTQEAYNAYRKFQQVVGANAT